MAILAAQSFSSTPSNMDAFRGKMRVGGAQASAMDATRSLASPQEQVPIQVLSKRATTKAVQDMLMGSITGPRFSLEGLRIYLDNQADFYKRHLALVEKNPIPPIGAPRAQRLTDRRQSRKATIDAARKLRRAAPGPTGKAMRRARRARQYAKQASEARRVTVVGNTPGAAPTTPAAAQTDGAPTMPTTARTDAAPATPAAAHTDGAPATPAVAHTSAAPATPAAATPLMMSYTDRLLAALPRNEGQPSAAGLPSCLDYLATAYPPASAALRQAAPPVRAPVGRPACVPALRLVKQPTPSDVDDDDQDFSAQLAALIMPAPTAAASDANHGRMGAVHSSPRPTAQRATEQPAGPAGCVVGGGGEGLGCCRALSDPGSPREMEAAPKRAAPGPSRHAAVVVVGPCSQPVCVGGDMMEEVWDPYAEHVAAAEVDALQPPAKATGLPAPRPPRLLEGENRIRLSQMTFVERLGEGTYGEVWKACLPTGQVVAYKAIKGVSPDYVASFTQEAQVMSHLSPANHPNLLRMLGVVMRPTAPGQQQQEEEEVAGIVTEFMEGGSLMDLINVRPATLPEKLHLLLHTTEGVHQMHVMGVGHFDLKPDNVLLDRDLRTAPEGAWETLGVKVADFGFARTKASGERYYTFRNADGTTLFMAPEVVRCSLLPDRVDQKTDVWALGVLAYTLDTRSYPYQGMTEASIMQGLAANRLRPDATRCSPMLRRLVQDCTAFDPAARPTMAEVVQRLRVLIDQERVIQRQQPGSCQAVVRRLVEQQEVRQAEEEAAAQAAAQEAALAAARVELQAAAQAAAEQAAAQAAAVAEQQQQLALVLLEMAAEAEAPAQQQQQQQTDWLQQCLLQGQQGVQVETAAQLHCLLQQPQQQLEAKLQQLLQRKPLQQQQQVAAQLQQLLESPPQHQQQHQQRGTAHITTTAAPDSAFMPSQVLLRQLQQVQ